MTKRRPMINWGELRELIETNLRAVPGFGNVRMNGKIKAVGGGLGHDHYLFVAGDRDLVLRMAKRVRPLKSQAEARESLVREGETLRRLAKCGLPFATPELICTVVNDAGRTVGLIESFVGGVPISEFHGEVNGRHRIEQIAEVAARIHELPKAEFAHLPSHPDSVSHVQAEIDELPQSVFEEWPIAKAVRDWIMSHLSKRESVVLHGDLLPQNLLWDLMDQGGIGVIDWEHGQIGDPAYDLAIVTRGGRRVLKESSGFQLLVAAFRKIRGAESMPASAVRIHELLLHVRWLAESARDQAAGTLEGHGPEQYALNLQAMLRRFESEAKAGTKD